MARHPDVQYIRFYTDGSAARKVEPVRPVKKNTLPRARKQKKIVLHVDPVAFLGIIMAVVMLVVMAASVSSLLQAQKNTARMEQYVAQLQAQNDTLQAEYEAGYDIDQVEQTAMALGMVPVDQVRHVQLQVHTVELPEPDGAWEQFCAFLTGLFA